MGRESPDHKQETGSENYSGKHNRKVLKVQVFHAPQLLTIIEFVELFVGGFYKFIKICEAPLKMKSSSCPTRCLKKARTGDKVLFRAHDVGFGYFFGNIKYYQDEIILIGSSSNLDGVFNLPGDFFLPDDLEAKRLEAFIAKFKNKFSYFRFLYASFITKIIKSK